MSTEAEHLSDAVRALCVQRSRAVHLVCGCGGRSDGLSGGLGPGGALQQRLGCRQPRPLLAGGHSAAAALSDEMLAAPLAPGRAAPWQLIQAMIAHNAYHTCEVISIRHMLGLWLDRT
jgi:hypothetical protein